MDAELEEVETELIIVQEELNSLLQRQEELLERRNQLQSLLLQSQGTSTSRETEEEWEEGEFPWTSPAMAALKSTFKVEKFRPLQASCVNSIMSDKDTILIMPTGGGKSLCYQLPAVLKPGLTLVISPLISLMEDQLLAVKRYGINASTLNSSCSRETVNKVHASMTEKESSLKLLYVTPEKLAKSKRFMSKLEKVFQMNRLSIIVIDEVHCASQWGHDFRTDYKILGILKRQFPSVPILGLTATATGKVLEDVKEMLSIKKCLVFRASYNRPNLFYEVRQKKSSQKGQMEDLGALIKGRFPAQSGIVYCFSRKDSEDVASGLSRMGIKASHYHADVPATQRSKVHMMWLNNSIQVIVATIAFGMGIDKADVRFVIHYSVSKSIENYYQESGRAGRDALPARCIILFRAADAFRQSTMVFTERTGLQNLYIMLKYCLNQAVCRRAIIAGCFGEQWKESDCNGSCDICSTSPNATTTRACTHSEQSTSRRSPSIHLQKLFDQDITNDCKTLVDIVEEGKHKDKRLTALKVADGWPKKKSLSLQSCEDLILHAIIQGVLKEEFHFTPYSTISYIGLGSKARALKRNAVKITIKTRGFDEAASLPDTPQGVEPGNDHHGVSSTKFSRTEPGGPLKLPPRAKPGGLLTVPSRIKPGGSLTVSPKVKTGGSVIKLPPRIKRDTTTTTTTKNCSAQEKLNLGKIRERILPEMLLSSTTISGSLLSKDIFDLPVKRLKLDKGTDVTLHDLDNNTDVTLHDLDNSTDATLHEHDTEGIIQIDSD